MLKQMRNDFKKYSWTLWLVIGAFIVGFIFSAPFRGDEERKTEILSIAGKVISVVEYQEQLLKMLENYSRQTDNKLNRQFITQLGIPEQVLQGMINNTIVRKEADKFRLSVSDEELSQKIIDYTITINDEKKGPVRVYAFRENGEAKGKFVGLQQYEGMLARNQIEVTEFERDRRNEIVIDKFKNLVTQGLVIDEQTLREAYRQEKNLVELDLIHLKTDRIKDKIAVAEDQLKPFYDRNKQDFKTQEKRQGWVIVFKFDDYKKEVKISEKDLFDYFKNNKRLFIVPGKTRVSRIFLGYDEKNKEEVRKKAEEVRKDLTGENFSAQAIAFSQDDKAGSGGDYGEWAWRELPGAETAAIENLDTGGISGLIDSGNGFALLYVPAKTAEEQEPFDKVKPRIRDTVERERLDVLIKEELSKIYAKLKDEKDIKARAEEMKFKVTGTPPVTIGQPIKDLDEAGYISRRFFSLKEGEVNSPVELMSGLAIVQLTKIEKPVVEAFENVKNKVREKLEEIKKIDLLEKEAETIARELNNLKEAKDIEKYLKEKNLVVEPFTYHLGNRLSYLPKKKDLDTFIFGLEENRYASPLKFPTEVAIVKAKSKIVTGDGDFLIEKELFYNQKIGELKGTFFNALLARASKNYKLDFFNQEIFEQVKEYVLGRFKD